MKNKLPTTELSNKHKPRKWTLYLSGTPFKALADNLFKDDEITQKIPRENIARVNSSKFLDGDFLREVLKNILTARKFIIVADKKKLKIAFNFSAKSLRRPTLWKK